VDIFAPVELLIPRQILHSCVQLEAIVHSGQYIQLNAELEPIKIVKVKATVFHAQQEIIVQ